MVTAGYEGYKNVLKGAKPGEVVTRFPPEPSGYLHIGHIKAAMMNYHYARMWGGKMILRFDDTNPLNEKLEFVENITGDLKRMDIVPDQITFSSDHFDKIIEIAKQLINQGNVYADDTPAEEMKLQRDEGIESKYRENTVEQNMKLFEDMLSGATGTFCLRAKLNMQDKVKCLRDPVLFRCKDVPHHRTGDKYKAYPTYDLACPIIDSIEGVTHALRTIEYRDRNALYAWVQKVCGIRPVVIYDFSKLCLKSTLLSKRKLRWFVEEGKVDGWSDPRFPTVQGIMRKGMTVDCLKQYMLEQGPSQNTNMQEWGALWSLNAKIIDAYTPRYSAIVKETACTLVVENGPETTTSKPTPLHPKLASLGTKDVFYSRNVFIERDDAKAMTVGQKITLMNWGNVTISRIEEGENPKLFGTIDEADTNFKGTVKVTWISADPAHTKEVQIIEYDHLINKEKIEEADNVEDIVNPNSKHEYTAYAEGSVSALKERTHLQFMRRGYYFIDKTESGDQKASLLFVPDGKTKAMSKVGHAVDAADLSKGKGAKDAKKPAAAAGKGEGGKLSKKELAKLAKKEKKAGLKAEAKGDAPKAAAAAEAKPAASSTPATGGNSTLTSMTLKKGFFNGPDADLWEDILTNQQWLGGAKLSQADAEASAIIKGQFPNPDTHPNLFYWCSIATKFTPEVMKTWPADTLPLTKKAEAPKAEAPKAAAADEDDFDPFADDGDDADAAAAAEAMKAKAIAAKKAKPLPIAKSIVLWDVKGYSDETDLDSIAARIFEQITQDGLVWKTEFKKEPLAFGIKKLVIGSVIEDEKVSTDDIIDRICDTFADEVQSVDIAAFNKI